MTWFLGVSKNYSLRHYQEVQVQWAGTDTSWQFGAVYKQLFSKERKISGAIYSKEYHSDHDTCFNISGNEGNKYMFSQMKS